MTARIDRSRRGRPPKGGAQRATLIAKLPADHAAQLVREAGDAGLPVTDYLALLICERKAWPVPSYITDALAADLLSPEPTLDLDLAS